MITLSIKDLKSKKVAIKCFTSLDKAKKEGLKIVQSSKQRIEGASYDTKDEATIVTDLMEMQEAQEGHPRGQPMPKPAPYNISFQVTLSKAVYEDINGIVAAINEVRKEQKLPPVTRSQFLETLVINFINTHVQETKEAAQETTKEEKETC